MKKFLLVLIAASVVTGLVLAFLAGRKEVAAEAAADKPLAAPTRVEVINGENVVTLDAATRTSSGVALAPLESISHRAEIPAYGAVLDLGDLTVLRNTLASANAEVAKADAALTVARDEYERVKGLFAANQNVAQKTVQAAEGAWRTATASAQEARAAAESAQATAEQRWGAVIAKWLGEGGPEIDRLRRQADLLVQVTLAPSQANVSAPAEASIHTEGGQLVAAKLVSPASRTDPRIQGRSYFYLLPAEGTNLLPGMNVVLLLPTGEPAPGVVVPGSAVVWLQGKPWAYVQVQPDRFARREVVIEQPVPDGWVQRPEFSIGTPVVVTGAQILLSEEFRAQISISD